MNKIFILFSLLAILACSKDNSREELTRDNLFQVTVSAKWQVNLFAKGDDIKTEEFANYKFTFLTSNTVKAENGTNSYNGTWDADYTDNSESSLGLILNIGFTTPEAFADLSRDWDVVSADQSTIRLRYVSGETIDFLTLVSTN